MKKNNATNKKATNATRAICNILLIIEMIAIVAFFAIILANNLMGKPYSMYNIDTFSTLDVVGVCSGLLVIDIIAIIIINRAVSLFNNKRSATQKRCIFVLLFGLIFSTQSF